MVFQPIQVDYFGAHLGWPTPSGVISVPSTTRKGQVSYLDPELKQKFFSGKKRGKNGGFRW